MKKKYRHGLPIEIIKNILSKLPIEDLINVYEAVDEYKEIIYYGIENYFNNKNNTHFLHKPLNDLHCDIYDYTGIYLSETDMKSTLNELKKIYNKHFIYKKIIDNNLFCQKCKYKINFDLNINNNKHISTCYNCLKNFCENCNKKCYNCEFDGYITHHCLNCEYRCFINLEQKIINPNITTEEMEYIKKLILETYCYNADSRYDMMIYSYEYIDTTEYTEIIKNFLKTNSEEIKKYISQ